MLLEVRQPGLDKASVLRKLATESGYATLLYAGDDLSDVPVFDLMARLRGEGRSAWSIAVSSEEVPDLGEQADLTVDDPQALVELLARAVAPPGAAAS
jgi:trehalose 6-phosphate phosphatase